MTPTDDVLEEIIRIVREKARGRTRYVGQGPIWDEVLVAEVDRLRAQIDAERASHTAALVAAGAAAVKADRERNAQWSDSMAVGLKWQRDSSPEPGMTHGEYDGLIVTHQLVARRLRNLPMPDTAALERALAIEGLAAQLHAHDHAARGSVPIRWDATKGEVKARFRAQAADQVRDREQAMAAMGAKA